MFRIRGRALGAVLLLALIAEAGDEEHLTLEQRVEKLEQGDDADRQAALEDEAEAVADEGLGLNMVFHKNDISGIFQIFGDVGIRWENPALPNRSNAFFLSGSFDLFFRARIGDHFNVLSETVFLSSVGTLTDSSKFDQERLWGAWAFSDLLQIKLGLEHGPISLWNNLFHHGRYLELTINRPFLPRFESDNGILPLHNAGIEFRGSVQTKAGILDYVVFVSNGRGATPAGVQEFSDLNDDKALDFGGGFRPTALSDLWIGVVFRIEEVPPNAPSRPASLRQYIASFQLDYQGERIEVLSEYAFVRDDDRVSNNRFEHHLGYAQIGYHINDQWTPYARFDIRDMSRGDPYYGPLNRDLDVWELLFGVRFDFLANAAIKIEIGFGTRDERDSGGAVADRSYIRSGFQLAWVF